jgi:predicted AlkP superfamily phosphohydrolase/phosphomutase
MGNRIVVIGLDAADPDLVEGWAREGHLPVIASLLEDGAWGRLSSTAEVSTGPGWPSFYSSTQPGSQGRFFTRQLESGTYRLQTKNADRIEATPFWVHVGHTGRTVAAVDVPKTHPRIDVNGVQVVGWGAHAPAWIRASSPPALVKTLVTSFGPHPVPSCDEVRLRSVADHAALRDGLVEGVKRKAAISEHILGLEEWDLFVTVFKEPHCVGHRLWHVMDRDHPDHDAEVGAELGNPVLDVYRAADEAVGRLVEAAGDATVVLFSPYGMGPAYGGSHLLPDVLLKLGLAATGPDDRKGGARRRSSLRDVLVDRTPFKLLKLARRVVPPRLWDEIACRLRASGKEWSRSRAFCVPGDHAGAIRVNLAGREPDGTVEAGEQYEALCEELEREIRALVNPDTGRPAVREVVRPHRLYRGKHVADFPDLTVRWTGDAPIRALTSARIGKVEGSETARRTGEHWPEGFVLVHGPGVEPGATVSAEEAGGMDIAPTILELMGVPVPDEMEGRVLRELLRAEPAADPNGAPDG